MMPLVFERSAFYMLVAIHAGFLSTRILYTNGVRVVVPTTTLRFDYDCSVDVADMVHTAPQS